MKNRRLERLIDELVGGLFPGIIDLHKCIFSALVQGVFH